LSIVTRKRISIGLIGDYDKSVPAHQAIPLALQSAAKALRIELGFEWVPTDEIVAATRVACFSGLWCVPGSPYRSMEGALLAIRHARESGVPFLGTCGGFQHAVIEYARNVLGWADAEHAETAPDAARAVISLLKCSLVETSGVVRFVPGSRIAAAYGATEATEGYRCRYGLNPEFRAALLAGPLRATAEDEDGEVRAVELDGHPFFVATLFQPERASLAGKSAPLVVALVRACAT
jgi:CTP synthase (UTP-ammonia lyase)